MRVHLHADGRSALNGAPLVTHNERLADPLDLFTQAIAAISKKRNKTLADHEEIGRLEWYGGLYTDPMIPSPDDIKGKYTIIIPAFNVLRCLQDGAKRHKRGLSVPRGVTPIGTVAPLVYDGPADPVGLWQSGEFSLRKTVGIQRSRTMRTRPMFVEWQTSLDIELDANELDVHTLRACWRDAGTYAGLGEMRPVYGRFAGTLEVVDTDVELDQVAEAAVS